MLFGHGRCRAILQVQISDASLSRRRTDWTRRPRQTIDLPLRMLVYLVSWMLRVCPGVLFHELFFSSGLQSRKACTGGKSNPHWWRRVVLGRSYCFFNLLEKPVSHGTSLWLDTSKGGTLTPILWKSSSISVVRAPPISGAAGNPTCFAIPEISDTSVL